MSKIIALDQYNYIFPLKNSNETFKKFKKNFVLNINSFKKNGKSIKFEMINAPFIFHNTIRRLIINEVPSVAFNRLYFYNNTSVVEDSDLQLRLALVPVDVDPEKLSFNVNSLPLTDENIDDFNENSTILFELITNYEKREFIHREKLVKIVGDEKEVEKYIKEFNKRIDMSVYSDDIKWIPFGNQRNIFINGVKTIEGILLNRIMPGEELNIRAVAVKGYGHDHAKFMPTSAAHGRMTHNIELKEDIIGKDAKILQGLFPKGVIEIKNNKAVVGNTLLLERAHKNYEQHESLKGKVEMSFNEKHYVWKIESVRPINQPANKIFVTALNAMIEKCEFYIENLHQINIAKKDEKTGIIKVNSFTKELFGKMCYIDIIKSKGNPNFPMFQFIGETSTLGSCLSFMINHVYGEEVMSAYSDIPNGIELTLEIIGKNSTDNSMDVLFASLKELSLYFSHIKVCFEKKFAAFVAE